MPWLDDPRFRRARDSVIGALSKNEPTFRKIKPIAFLCGGANSARREFVKKFLEASRPDLLIFYADNVWRSISDVAKHDALAMEGELAALSDIVIVIVESPGTFTELGAFSMFEPLCKKLLPILDADYEHADSFINTGPIRAVNSKSTFGPAIWADFAVILASGDELTNRLKALPKQRSSQVENIGASDKHLLFFLCDLLAVFGPCVVSDLVYYCQRTVGPVDPVRVSQLVSLAMELQLVKAITHNGTNMFVRPLKDGEHPSFQQTDYFSLPDQRATILSAMFKIPEAAAAIDEVARQA